MYELNIFSRKVLKMKAKIEKKNYIFCLILLSCLVMTNIVSAQQPIGWWKLDDGEGKSAIDSSGNSRDGNIQGDGEWVKGRIGDAMKFNGSDSYIRIPGLPLANKSFTITVWFFPTELKGNHTLISQGVRAENRQMQLRVGGPDAEFNVPVNGFRYGFCRNNTDTPADIIQTNKWYHVACTYDYDKEVRTFYLNGEEIAQDTKVSPFLEEKGALILGAAVLDRNIVEYFNGILDDIRIYDMVLTKEKINEVASSGADTQYLNMYNTIENAKNLIEEKELKKAKSLLKKEISTYEKFKQKNPDKDMLSYMEFDCRLHYLHGLVSDALGDKKNDIAEDFKKAVSIDSINSDEKILGDSLLWLSQNMKKDYKNVIYSLLDNNSNYFAAVMKKSHTMISNNESEAVIFFLEDNIASYTQWRNEHPFDEAVAEDMLAGIYIMLAKAKIETNAPVKEIADIYIKVFESANITYPIPQASALVWLIENNRIEELTQIVKNFTQEEGVEQTSKDMIQRVYKHYESEKDAEGFTCLLETLFTKAKYPADWAVIIESLITDKTSRWANVYYSSLENKPKLQLDMDCKVAEKLVSEEKYKEAADLFEDILTRCESDNDKGELEFSLLKCLFDGGFYNKAISKIDGFISGSYKGTHKDRVKEAILMKGRSLIQLDEIDKAIDVYSAIMVEYPEAKDLSETTFYIGYCYMKQNKLKEATEAFEIVINSYPDSPYANQAKLSLARIKDNSNG